MSLYFPATEELGHHVIFGNTHIATLAGDHLQLAVADIPAGGVVDWHAHPNEQLGLVVSGSATFHVGDEEKTLRAGELYRIPGGVRHKVVAVGGPCRALDVFYPIRDEYR